MLNHLKLNGELIITCIITLAAEPGAPGAVVNGHYCERHLLIMGGKMNVAPI